MTFKNTNMPYKNRGVLNNLAKSKRPTAQMELHACHDKDDNDY